MERIAVIDLGTNTFNLLIAEASELQLFRKVFSHRIPVMLGEGTINSNLISPVPFKRGIDALKVFKTQIENLAVNKIIALATSAIRSAENGDDFVSVAKKETGIEIMRISGDKEAELIFLGNAMAAKLGSNSSLVMDIGGGSTEFIIGNKHGIIWEKSFMLGAARLLSKFKPEDPIEEKTIEQIEKYFDEELKELFVALEKYHVSELIGSSGAFDSFAELIDVQFHSMEVSEKKICYDFEMAEFEMLHRKILLSTLAERLIMKGLIQMRAEMIVISFIFTSYILKKCRINKMRATTWSLKEGALIEYLLAK